MESKSYSSVKKSCNIALKKIRRRLHKQALDLLKALIATHENDHASLALIYRVNGTVSVAIAETMDDPNEKQSCLKNALAWAKKAAESSPCSVEFAHFYANLLYETATDVKEYEEAIRECDRGLAIENPIDPGKESLLEAGQLKIEDVRNELRALHQRANINIKKEQRKKQKQETPSTSLSRGREKRTVATSSAAVNVNVVNEVSSPSTVLNFSDMSLNLDLEGQLEIENNEVMLVMESPSYFALKSECVEALKAVRSKNRIKAMKLLKGLHAKHEDDPVSLALICRVQGTVFSWVTDDPASIHWKNAVESAKKATVLSPCSVEFGYFYAKLLYEMATERKEYEESLRECDRALAIKNPIDPGKEIFQEESRLKISVPEGRIEHVHNELRALRSSISYWLNRPVVASQILNPYSLIFK